MAITNLSRAQIDSCNLGAPLGNMPSATVTGYQLPNGDSAPSLDVGHMDPGETIRVPLLTEFDCPTGRLTIAVRIWMMVRTWDERHTSGIRWAQLAIGT